MIPAGAAADRGLRRTAHASDAGSWEVVERRASPLPEQEVGTYTGYAEAMAQPLRRREVPSGWATLVVAFSEPLRIVGMPVAGYRPQVVRAFVAGLGDGPALTEHTGTQSGVEVRLTPLGAHRLLGVPMRELTNTVVDLEGLWGSAAVELTERLAAARDWSSRFELIDRALLPRLDDGPEPAAEVRRAWDRLTRSHGAVRVETLAEDAGWSRQRLTRTFGRQVGLAPKAAARVLRFRRACAGLVGPHPLPLAATAARAGYADQAHLTREFRRLAGCTPGAFRAAQLPDGGGTAP